MVGGRWPGGICIFAAVLLVFASTGAVRQEVGKRLVLDDDGNVIPEAEIEANMGSGYRKTGAIAGGLLMGIVGGMLITGRAFVYEGWELDPATAVAGAIVLEGGGILLGYGIGKEYDRRRAIHRIRAQRHQRKEHSRSDALLHMENGTLCFGTPSFSVRPVVLYEGEGTWEYCITLASKRF